LNAGTVYTSGSQTYNDAVTLGLDTTLNGAVITFGSTIKSNGTQRSLAVNDSGLTTFGGAIGSTIDGDKLTTLTTDSFGTVALNAGTVYTSGSQTYNDAVTLGLDTTLNGAAITFGSTIKSNGTQRSLAVNDSGQTTFGGVIGSSTDGDKLTTLTTDSAGTVALNAGTVYTSGSQTYNDAVTLGLDTTLNGAVITFGSTIKSNGTQRSLAVNDSGLTTFGGAIGSTIDGDKLTTLTTDSFGTVALNAGTVYTSGSQTYNDAVTLGLDTTLNGAVITLGSTIKSNGTQRSLTVNDSGLTTFGGAIGSTIDGDKLTTLTTDSAGTVALNAGTVYTSGAQTYNDAVTLGLDTTLNGAVITLGSTIKSNGTQRSLTVNDSGLTTFGGAIGSTIDGDKLTTLTTDGAGTVALNAGTVYTSGAQTYNDAVILGVGTTLTTTDTPVLFGSTVNSATGQTNALTVDAGTGNGGNVTFTGVVGATGSLGALTVNSGSLTTFMAAVNAASVTTDTGGSVSLKDVITAGAQSYGEDATLSGNYTTTNNGLSVTGTTTLGGDTTISTGSGNVSFTGAVDGPNDLSVMSSGAVTFTAATGSVTPLASLTATGSSLSLHDVATVGSQTYTGAATTHSTYQTQGGAIVFNSALTLAGDLVLDTTVAGASGANVSFGGTISTSPAQTYGMMITAGTGFVTATGAVSLPSVSITSASGATFDNAANTIGIIDAKVGSGGLSLLNAATITVGSKGISSVGGGTVDIRTATGNVVLDGGVSVDGTGNIVLFAAGNFTNNAGAGALATGSGRWLVYSTDPLQDQRNGLVPEFKLYNASIKTSLPTATNGKDGFVYTIAPVITPALTGTVQKIYDRTTDATLASGNYNATAGAIDGDVVTLNNPDTGTYDTKDVNTGKKVSVSGLAIASVVDGIIPVYGYTLSTTSLSGNIGVITKAPLTVVNLVALDKVYDGTTTAFLSTAAASVNSGVFSGDVINLLSATGTFADKKVGTAKLVTATDIQLSGDDMANYFMNPVTGLTANITKRTLVVFATSDNKVYDGGLTATVHLSDNRIINDVLDYSSYTANFLDKNAAVSKYVGVTAITLAGDDLGNYTYNTTTSAYADIMPKPLTASVSAPNKVYDGSVTATPTIKIESGLVGTERLVVTGTATFNSKDAKNADLVTVNTVTLADGVNGLASNYSLGTGWTVGASITAKKLTASVAAPNKVYDGTTTASPTLTITNGLLIGEKVTATGTATFNSKDVASANLVTVNTVTLADGVNGLASNYTLGTGEMVVASITARSLTASVTVPEKVYDGTVTALPTLTIASGLVSGESVNATGTATFNSKNVASANLVTVNSVALANGVNGLASNYSLASGQTITAHINAKSLTASVTVPEKVYDGTVTVLPTLTITNGLVSTETLVVTGTATFNSKDVASANLVTVNSVALANGVNGLASNYSL
ncbi:MAG: YDG domain-containing protein, partial [Chlorobiaceae bacterium]